MEKKEIWYSVLNFEYRTDDVNKSFDEGSGDDQLQYIPRPLGQDQVLVQEPPAYVPGGGPKGRVSGAKVAGVKRPAPPTDPREGYFTKSFQRGVFQPGVNVQEQLAVEQHGGNLIANLAALVAAQVSNLEEEVSVRKRKKKKEGLDDMVEEEELEPVVFDGLRGMDNGVDIICWEARMKLRPFTGDWEKFWANQPRVDHPVRESLDASFLRMDPVNGMVTMRDHDRGAPRKIKQYLKDNLRVTKTKAWVSSQGMEEHDIGLSKNYAEPTGVYEVMSAIHQYNINVWMIRRDDWSGMLMIKVLHDVKYFAPLLISKIRTKAERDSKQLEVITWFADHVLELNSQRGRLHKTPLMYDDVRKVATSAANRIYSGSGVALGWEMDMGACSFDPYTTAVEAGQEWQSQWQGGRGGGGGGGYGRGGARGRRGGGRGAYQGGGGLQGGYQQQGGGPLAVGHLGAGGQPGGSQGGGAALASSRACLDFNRGACQYQNCKFAHKCNKVHSHFRFVDVSSLHSRRWCLLEGFVARTTQLRTISGLHGIWNGSRDLGIFIWKIYLL